MLGMRRDAARKGFTLIELLIVIAIVVVLLGIVTLLVNPVNQLGRARNIQRESPARLVPRVLPVYLREERCQEEWEGIG